MSISVSRLINLDNAIPYVPKTKATQSASQSNGPPLRFTHCMTSATMAGPGVWLPGPTAPTHPTPLQSQDCFAATSHSLASWNNIGFSVGDQESQNDFDFVLDEFGADGSPLAVSKDIDGADSTVIGSGINLCGSSSDCGLVLTAHGPGGASSQSPCSAVGLNTEDSGDSVNGIDEEQAILDPDGCEMASMNDFRLSPTTTSCQSGSDPTSSSRLAVVVPVRRRAPHRRCKKSEINYISDSSPDSPLEYVEPYAARCDTLQRPTEPSRPCLSPLPRRSQLSSPSLVSANATGGIPVSGTLNLEVCGSEVVYCVRLYQSSGLKTGQSDASQDYCEARRARQRSPDRSTPRRVSPKIPSARHSKRRRFTHEEEQLLRRLKETERLSWAQITEQFPSRTKECLQVHYCTKLRKQPSNNRYSAMQTRTKRHVAQRDGAGLWTDK
ncbi:hypothetical protein I7I50_03742 [Histoplasma capsulatum G186AR]|uniref:Myb-like domain-containing protein n=1 Tax=Ajellomyces capsulatus TaxID=5037 RepID=A0A8H7YLD1_AJECA|nr:hypothetical protein I7I52_04649 [Histoplasma capsulatum]QSS74812.1 hypothetical protein I7I50_03742 [Histoplasma capsulatum G186AR]